MTVSNQLTIKQALRQAVSLLGVSSETPELDAQLLLMKVLNVSKSHLFTWPAQQLTEQEEDDFSKLVQRRLVGEPIAYILGEKEFWSLAMKVSSATLVPRPETELLVSTALEKLAESNNLTVADLGTGCGTIALALAHEKPDWNVIGTDLSDEAIKIALLNKKQLNIANVEFLKSDWLQSLPKHRYGLIVSNPPYIAKGDPSLQAPALRYEPQTALVAEQNGYSDLFFIIEQSESYLDKDGWLMLEHGAEQGEMLRDYFCKQNYQKVETIKDLAGRDRITLGCLSPV